MFEIELIICIKMDLALNNLQALLYYKIQLTNQISSNSFKNKSTDYLFTQKWYIITI